MNAKDITKLDIEGMSREELVSLNKALIAHIITLEQQIEASERAKKNNSKNSSLPPSTDQKPEAPVQPDAKSDKQEKVTKAANTYNRRRQSGRLPGGQKNRAGKTFTKGQAEELLKDKDVIHLVVHSGQDNGGRYIVKYVVDIKVVPVVTEIRIHPDTNGKVVIPPELRSDVTYGHEIKALTILLFGQHVVAIDRIGELFSTLTGGRIHPSHGSIYKFCQIFSGACEPEIASIKEKLLASRKLCTDATNVTTNGHRSYIRNFSTTEAVLYVPMQRKTLAELQTIDVLVAFMGVLVHDHETALYHFGSGHAECIAHLLRYLIKNTQETGNDWSQALYDLLCAVLHWKHICQGQDMTGFNAEALSLISETYDRIVAEGRKQNLTTEGEIASKEERRLLNRLEKYKNNHLLFAWDFEVEFTNNMSERDLRKCKGRQKMAGGFRTEAGKALYCRMMSIIETAKRKGEDLLECIKAIFQRNMVNLVPFPA